MKQSNYKIAITGGIGSGKSTVAKIIKEQGYTVYSCDEIYDDLLKDNTFLAKIAAQFSSVILPDGTLDRQKLSEIVFNDKSALNKLNFITHPAIMEEFFKRAEDKVLCFCEVPLLFENGFETLFNDVLVILRDKRERINFICRRDGIDENAALKRINSQFNYDNCSFAKYYVIHNDANLNDLKQKTIEFLSKIKKGK